MPSGPRLHPSIRRGRPAAPRRRLPAHVTTCRTPHRRARIQVRALSVLLLLVLAPSLSGCLGPPMEQPCDAGSLVRTGVAALARLADPDGGVPAHGDTGPDPRTTAWALLAAGLARRTGHEGGFDPGPHIAYLQAHLPDMLAAGSPIDSPANNLSLARAALQAWGRPASGIPLEDPSHPDVRTLADAWAVRYDAANGSYGVRFNEHLFGAFAAWLSGPSGSHLGLMADHTVSVLTDPETSDPTTRDAWWAAYARAALGPDPRPPAAEGLADRLEATLVAHQVDEGGVRGFVDAARPDASTTAAALVAWGRTGEAVDGPHVGPAIAWLCTLQRDDGSIPFDEARPILPTKTTSEVVLAVSLLLRPIPWASDEPTTA